MQGNKTVAKKAHSFAVCAYKESPYLESALESLVKQSEKSDIFICTSTPCEYIENIANKFGIQYYVGNHKSGIGRDWNFAYSKAKTDYVTIAHQDDIYERNYTKRILELLKATKNPIIAYTDYCEIRDGNIILNNKLLNIKRLLNNPLKYKAARYNRFLRRCVLSMGDPVCCPSVCINRARFPHFMFNEDMATNLDWDAWERLSKEDGAFIYVPEVLMRHRIHKGSATTAAIVENNGRTEDINMFKRFWPAPIAKVLSKMYASSENSNNL